MQAPHRISETATIYDSYLVTALCVISSFRVWIMYDKMLSNTDKENEGKWLWEGFFQGGSHFKVCHTSLNDLSKATRRHSNSGFPCATHRITWKRLVIGDGGKEQTNQCNLSRNLIKTSFSVPCHRKGTNLLSTWAWSMKNARVVSERGFWLGNWILILARRDHSNCFPCALVCHCDGVQGSFPPPTRARVTSESLLQASSDTFSTCLKEQQPEPCAHLYTFHGMQEKYSWYFLK